LLPDDKLLWRTSDSAVGDRHATAVLGAVLAPLQPRGLTRKDAAAYCSLTPDGFDEWIKRGIIPGTQRWDRKAINLALDRASGLESAQEPDDEFEQWRATYDARSP